MKPRKIIASANTRSIVIDTNLLLLYLIGKWDVTAIQRFSRLKDRQYSEESYDLLLKIIQGSVIVATPNILTEVSNFAHKDHDKDLQQKFQCFAELICVINEDYVPSSEASKFHRFHEFGLADCSIIKLAQKGHPVLTADGRLYSYLVGTNLTVANFNHLIFNLNLY